MRARKKVLALLIALMVLPTVEAGELGLGWDFVDHPPPPYSYILSRDGVPWTDVVNLQDPDPNDPTRSVLVVTGLPVGCSPANFTIQAVNAGGPSGPSNVVSSIPRPSGTGGVGNITVTLNNTGVHQIHGMYFPDDIQVYVDGIQVLSGVNRLDCGLVEIPVTSGLPVSVCVQNPDMPLAPNCWSQPPPPPPTGLQPF